MLPDMVQAMTKDTQERRWIKISNVTEVGFLMELDNAEPVYVIRQKMQKAIAHESDKEKKECFLI